MDIQKALEIIHNGLNVATTKGSFNMQQAAVINMAFTELSKFVELYTISNKPIEKDESPRKLKTKGVKEN